jgi:hypothetical protein
VLVVLGSNPGGGFLAKLDVAAERSEVPVTGLGL